MGFDLSTAKPVSPLDLALQAEGVDGPKADFVRSIYQQESASGKNTKTSNAGAVGGMQIIPATFQRVADKGWNIADPIDNARAGVRYASLVFDKADGDPALAGAGYYGGEGAIEKARNGVAVYDPHNPKAPNTLQYGAQVASRIPAPAASTSGGFDLSTAKPVPDPSEAQPKAEVLPAVETARRALQMATPAGIVSSLFSKDGRQALLNGASGAVRGAASIGATLIAPLDMARDAAAGKGLTLESNRQRRGDVDNALKDMGADTDSALYQTGKIGTEVLGTLGAGGAAANALGRVAPRVAPSVLNAIRSGGFTTGSRAAPGVVGAAADVGTRVAGGAINAGVSAGLVDPDQAAVGAAAGGAMPVVSKVMGSAGKVVGNALSSRMARNNAVEKVAGTLGDDVGQTIADIQTHYPVGAENIPLSAAAITKNPKLAQVEQGSRLRSNAPWYEFDQKQGKAVFDNVLKATGDADELGARYGQRQENWREAWQKATDNQKPRIWQQRMTKFGADLETAMQSPDSSNPAVRNVLEAINAEFDRVGPNFTPGHLQQLRANLNGKVQPLSPDVFKSAPRDNPAIKSLIAEMDDILNASTGGKWQKVIEGYAKDSQAVHASKAAAKLRGSFVDPATGRTMGTALDPAGDVPKITEAGLGRAMNAARMPDGSLALSGGAEQRLSATLDALRRQNIVQGVKRSATAGGGSDTVPNALAAGAHAAGAPNLLMQVLGAAKRMGTAKTDAEMAKLLSNPDELAKTLEAFRRPVNPNLLGATLYRAVPAIAADR